jgi:hypothetical protein
MQLHLQDTFSDRFSGSEFLFSVLGFAALACELEGEAFIDAFTLKLRRRFVGQLAKSRLLTSAFRFHRLKSYSVAMKQAVVGLRNVRSDRQYHRRYVAKT